MVMAAVGGESITLRRSRKSGRLREEYEGHSLSLSEEEEEETRHRNRLFAKQIYSIIFYVCAPFAGIYRTTSIYLM